MKLSSVVALSLLTVPASAQSITIQGTVDLGRGGNGTFGPITAPLTVTPPPGGGGGPPGGGGGPPAGGCANDGSAAASAGNPRFPKLLDGYITRPPCYVAGVDYNVGVPAGTVLKNPATLSNNPNISLNTGSHQVRANGSGYTIDAIDFAADGGWQLILYGSNITVQNSNFSVGSNGNAMINGNVGGQNNTVKYSSLNGNARTDNLDNANIFMSGGTTTVMYCILENSASDLMYVGGSGSAVQTLLLKNNLIYNAGQVAGSHPDWLQLGGGTYTVDIEYNTWYQTAATVGPGTQGIFADSGNNNAKVVGTNVISNNTIVTLSGARVNFLIAALAVSGAGNTFAITNNYMDPTGNNNAVYKYQSSQNTQTGNINMLTGAPLNN